MKEIRDMKTSSLYNRLEVLEKKINSLLFNSSDLSEKDKEEIIIINAEKMEIRDEILRRKKLEE